MGQRNLNNCYIAIFAHPVDLQCFLEFIQLEKMVFPADQRKLLFKPFEDLLVAVSTVEKRNETDYIPSQLQDQITLLVCSFRPRALAE